MQTRFGYVLVVMFVGLAWMCGCPASDDDDSAVGDDDDAVADDDDDSIGDDDDDDDSVGDDDDDSVSDDDDDDSSNPADDVLTNFPDPCKSWSAVMPLAGEEGQLAAARLTPTSWPYDVEKVVYQLLHGETEGVECNAGRSHRVEIFAAVGPTPPTSPVDALVAVTEEAEVQDTERLVVVDLEPPLTLEQGEDLFVAVELTGIYPDVGCLSMCVDGPTHDDRNWWSNATGEPYSWAELSGYGVQGNLVVVAYRED